VPVTWVGRRTKGFELRVVLQIVGKSQVADSGDTQRSTRLRETQVDKATICRKAGRWTVARFRCDENFCGSFDNSTSIEPWVPACAGQIEVSHKRMTFTYPQVGTSTGTNHVAPSGGIEDCRRVEFNVRSLRHFGGNQTRQRDS